MSVTDENVHTTLPQTVHPAVSPDLVTPFSLLSHPSNLMLDRMSGKILHIDFGDCFEVAMTREKFPEKIPFRLTRMLVNAMEVRQPAFCGDEPGFEGLSVGLGW